MSSFRAKGLKSIIRRYLTTELWVQIQGSLHGLATANWNWLLGECRELRVLDLTEADKTVPKLPSIKDF